MRLRAALGLLLCLCLAPVAHAQTASQPAPQSGPASAKDAFRRGEAAYSAGNYEAAVREWLNAYSVDPRPRIHFNLSQAYERMGQLENAIASLKRFVETSDPGDPTYSDANARLVALQQRLAATGVNVQGGAEGGSILVDGEDWGRTPRPDKITVTPGNHVIVVRWPSGQEFRTNVYVPPGQVVDISVGEGGKAAGPAAAPSTAPSAAAARPAERRSDRRWIWYAAGGGVAAAGVGMLAYGIARGAADNDCGKRTDGFLTYCDPDGVDKAKAQSLAGYITGGVLIAGGASVALIGALTGRRDDRAVAGTRCGIGLASASCTLRF